MNIQAPKCIEEKMNSMCSCTFSMVPASAGAILRQDPSTGRKTDSHASCLSDPSAVSALSQQTPQHGWQVEVDLTACGSQNPFVARSGSSSISGDFMLLRAQNMSLNPPDLTFSQILRPV